MDTSDNRKRHSTDLGGDRNIKKIKISCKYGEKCFRRNVLHLKNYDHPHLNALLVRQTRGQVISLPNDLTLPLSPVVLKDQLRIMMDNNIKPETKNNHKAKSPRIENADSGSRSTTPVRKIHSSSNNVASHSRSPTRKMHASSHSRSKSIDKGREISRLKPKDDISSDTTKVRKPDEKQKRSPSSNSEVTNKPSPAPSIPSSSHAEVKPKKIEPYQTEPINLIFQTSNSCSSAYSKFVPVQDNQEENIEPSDSYVNRPRRTHEKLDIRDFCPVVANKGEFALKLAKAAPYYLFYTTVTSAPETHEDSLSITFQELLDKSLGELESSLQINFMVDVAWLLAQYTFADYRTKPLTILYGEESEDLKDINRKVPHVKTHRVQMADAFGKHHTKMSLMSYEDGTMRVIVSTANLYEPDWDNRTQGVWVSPTCMPLPDGLVNSEDGNGPTQFKSNLLQYLLSYDLPLLQPWVEKVIRTDFSHINVFLITSVPGMHRGTDLERFGHKRLASVLSKHCTIMPEPTATPSQWSIIAQCSSIGSLGPQSSSWLCGQFRASLSRQTFRQLMSPPSLSVVYPTLENVRRSHDNLLGGGCLPYRRDQHSRQSWLENHMCQWKAHSLNRNKAMPHIKTYCRLSPDVTKMAWFVLTSANLSKAAWGYVPQSPVDLRLNIKSYEAGVLFLPLFVTKQPVFYIQSKYAEPDPEIEYFPFPYDLPLTSYGRNDGPFFMDYLR